MEERKMKGMQKYEMKAIVGEGAYGKVFMARNKETGEVGKSHQTEIMTFLSN